MQQAIQPAVAEATTLKQMMLKGANLGLNRIIFEGDCETVVRAMNSEKDSEIVIKPVIHDILLLLEQHKDWQVNFVIERLI